MKATHPKLFLASLLALLSQSLALDAPNYPLGDNLGDCLIASNTTVLTPNHDLYDTARQTWNSRTQFQPQYVVRPNSTAEVQHSVRCATHYKTAITAKSGGHGYAGYAIGGEDGDVTVDLANMKSIEVGDDGLVRAETGNHLWDLYQAIYEQGNWALPGGICPQVGIGGHTAFGGHGPLSRKLGLLLDRVVEAEVVFANGTASNVTEGSDAFFAIAGAAPSFATVTSFTYQAEQAPANTVIFSYSLTNRTVNETAGAFDAFQTFMDTADLTNDFSALLTLTPGSFELSGTYFGSEEAYHNVSRPLVQSLNLRDGDSQDVYSVTEFIDLYTQIYGDFSPVAEPKSFYSKSLMVDEPLPLSDARSFFDYLSKNATKADEEGYGWYIIVEAYNGAVHNISTDARSFAHRDALLTFQFFAEMGSSEESLFGLVDGMVDSITTSPRAAYPNYVDPRLANWQQLYYGSNYDRLKTIKADLDPQNTFRFPQSVEMP